MRCDKCGSEINPNSPFCGICGEPIKPPEPVVQPVQQVTMPQSQVQAMPVLPPPPQKHFCGSCGTEALPGATICTKCGNLLTAPPTSAESMKMKMQNTKEKIAKHKKKILAVLILLAVCVVGFAGYTLFYDGTKISWDAKYGDYANTHVTGGVVKLKVEATDKKGNEIKDVTFSVDSGEVKGKDFIVEWTLPEKPGTYKITAKTPNGKKITKEITVLENDFNNILTNDMIHPEEEETEKEPAWPKVDSLPKDEEFTHKEEKANVEVVATGLGDMWTTNIEISWNSTFDKTRGVLPEVYDLSTKGTLTKAYITIEYDWEEVKDRGLSEKDLALYQFNVSTKKLERTESIVDTDNHLVKAEVTQFSKYVIADVTKVNTASDINVLFIIDDSLSMYSEEQINKLGHTAVGAEGNDTEFKRLELSKQLIDLFSSNYSIGVAQFSGDYELEQKFTTNKQDAKAAVDRIKNSIEGSTGTAIVKALTYGIAGFEKNEKATQYIILMTDGKENRGTLDKDRDKIIKDAQEKGVRVCVIGLGEVDSKELTDIAEKTGCGFYHATTSITLDEMYKLLGSSINYGLVDTDNDGKADSSVTLDSGFIISRDGLSFTNYSSILSPAGHSYGMAAFAMAYYTGQMPYYLEEIDKWDFYFGGISWFNKKADGYNLRDTFFFANNGNKAGKNLYEYKFSSEALSLYTNKPGDYRAQLDKDSNYMIQKKYYDLMEKLGASFKMDNYNGKNKGIKKYQTAILNTVSPSLKESVGGEEYNLLQAIYRLYILQADDERISFTASPDKAYAKLEADLKSGTPSVLTINRNHAVNALRVLKDNSDSNKFKIEIYDNNYPGQTRYINVERMKFNRWAAEISDVENDYKYAFEYEGKKVSLTIHTPVMQ